MGIPLMNADELPEMDPYEEVAQQGQVPPLSPAYVPDPIELDEHIRWGEDTDEDFMDFLDEPKDGKEDDDEDPKEDPKEEEEPFEGSDETIELANDLMDQKIRTYAERQSKNKRRADDASRNNHGQQQQPNKRQNVARAYTAGPGEKKAYTRNQPLCTKHFKKNYPKLKNNGTENGNGRARGKAYILGRGDTNPESNTVTGTFLLNNRYALILFDTGTDRSFVSTAFSALINIALTTLDNNYDVKLADGKIIRVNTILRCCTLDFLNHPFNIDLMPVPLGSFDVIIGMDWLREHHAVIVCNEKIVRVPFGNETLIFQGKRNDQEDENKSKEKRFKDMPIVRDFPEVFPKYFPGIPPTRQVEFQIDLVPGAAPVAHAPYRLAPSEMKELADQLQELSDKIFIRPSSSP
uniref:Putative reverse transcriptase domain-containing protein n=1 Tax=Tanacetum cinerariifolium TaxID=118510 RepID=A0A699GSX7_TANCI|nr:putative reverse transcriptase domain-containing protein [Tanacetum cinerariifolium]